MSANREVENWITINHNHVPVYKGESSQDAFNRSVAIMNEKKRESDINKNKKEADILNNLNEKNNLVTFQDFPESTHSYNIDDINGVEEFMNTNSNCDNLISQMNQQERNAFHKWSSGEFTNGCQYKPFSEMSEDEQTATKIFDKYLDQATLKQGVKVVRTSTPQLLGLSNSTLSDIKNMEDAIVKCPANLSASCAFQGLDIEGDKSIQYIIHIPANTKGAGMWIGDYRINTHNSKQREFMLNRNSVFKVGGASNFGGYIWVDLYYLGKEPHNYS